MVTLFETGLCTRLPFGPIEATAAMVMTGTMELITLAAIPLTLKYVKHSAWRIGIIGLLMTLNTACYYLSANVSFGYMAIILLLTMPFVWPKENSHKWQAGAEEVNGPVQ